MKIVTWNINGVRARIGNLLHWLGESKPDIVCLQEIKTVDDQFPRAEIEALGYNVETHGQKGFNGVAILSKLKFDEVNRSLPGDDGDEQARFIEGVFSTTRGALRVASIYLPNGNPIDDPVKFPDTLAWMARLERWAEERLALEEALVIAGDYNVIPEPIDARHPENWVNDALFQPQTRQAFRRLKNLGFTEAVRAVTDAPDTYTFWDYQAGAWQKNNGIRID
ncbi:MAG: exodeoxyribonuclease III, partial [Mesorhizobium sp.]